MKWIVVKRELMKYCNNDSEIGIIAGKYGANLASKECRLGKI